MHHDPAVLTGHRQQSHHRRSRHVDQRVDGASGHSSQRQRPIHDPIGRLGITRSMMTSHQSRGARGDQPEQHRCQPADVCGQAHRSGRQLANALDSTTQPGVIKPHQETQHLLAQHRPRQPQYDTSQRTRQQRVLRHPRITRRRVAHAGRINPSATRRSIAVPNPATVDSMSRSV